MSDEELSPLKTGLRAQDIQTSLQDIDLGALNAETKNVQLIGMAERLAIHVRGADVIDDYKRLEYIASQFGIHALLLPRVLDVLGRLGWVRVQMKGTKVERIEETVPYFSDIYSAAGKFFSESDPSEIEVATLAVCESLAVTPASHEEVRKRLGLDAKAFRTVLDIGLSHV